MTLPHWISDHENVDFQIVSEDGERILLRGADHVNSPATFLVVGPVSTQSPRDLVARLTNEFSLRSHLDGAWAVRPAKIANNKGVTSLVLEDPGGDSLIRHIGEPVEMSAFLRIAIAISSALSNLHEAGLLHKDIKPSNILVSPSGDRAWLTGFGIASRLPRERQTPAPPAIIAGTFAYMAPEQTGRMNRSIDTRSDLYALGVTLYEMLTGTLPFVASGPMEWIHCHVARRPVPPDERLPGVIPHPVSDIVMKLLAKAAEDRYHTAAGLRSDLQHCLDEWEINGTIRSFALGSHDTPNKLVFRERLYGREVEVGRLINAFDRVVSRGSPELILVSGHPGIGKSAIVDELHRSLVSRNGHFAMGKFDQYKRGIPYATLSQALQDLLKQLLSKDESEMAGWREAIITALGSHGQLLINLIPELELVIGKQSAVPNLTGSEAQSRLRLVLRQFIEVFARADHPLVLFLDDLQWLDPETLDIFENSSLRSRKRLAGGSVQG